MANNDAYNRKKVLSDYHILKERLKWVAELIDDLVGSVIEDDSNADKSEKNRRLERYLASIRQNQILFNVVMDDLKQSSKDLIFEDDPAF